MTREPERAPAARYLNRDTAVKRGMSETEADLIKLAFLEEKYARAIREADINPLESDDAEVIFQALNRIDDGTRPVDTVKLAEMLEGDQMNALEQVTSRIVPEGTEDRMFQECMKQKDKERLQREERLLIDSLSLADEEENQEEIVELTKKLMDLQQRIKLI